ncbi:MAG: redoxin domain-containing protein [Ferruginibacter sp.]
MQNLSCSLAVFLGMKTITYTGFILLFSLTIKAQSLPAWKINDVVNYYNKQTDSVYVINFWATYCKPCVAEIPYLQRITGKYASQKVKLLLVSLDLPAFYPLIIQRFAKKNNFTAGVVWLNETDAGVFCPVIDKDWSGSIPATIFVNAATGYKKFIKSAMSESQFELELKKAIGKK